MPLSIKYFPAACMAAAAVLDFQRVHPTLAVCPHRSSKCWAHLLARLHRSGLLAFLPLICALWLARNMSSPVLGGRVRPHMRYIEQFIFSVVDLHTDLCSNSGWRPTPVNTDECHGQAQAVNITRHRRYHTALFVSHSRAFGRASDAYDHDKHVSMQVLRL